MSDIHIDDFYKDAAKILLQLYNHFPKKSILYVDDIAGSDEPDEFGLHSPRFQAGFSTMVWLAEQGYLKYDSAIKKEALDQAVLTEQGFLLLSSRSELDFGEGTLDDLQDEEPANMDEQPQNHNGSIPTSIMEQSKSNINQLRKALQSGSSIMINQCINYMLNKSFNR